MSTRVSFDRINSVFDGLDQQGHVFVLGTIPAFGNEGNLLLKCQQVQYPGYGNEAYDVASHGHVVRVRGRKTYPRSLSVTYFEDQQMRTNQTFKRWHEYIVGSNTGNSGGYKRQYSTRASLYTFDHVGKNISEVRFDGLFIQEIPDIQYDGTSSALIQVQCTFSYDRHTDSIIPIT